MLGKRVFVFDKKPKSKKVEKKSEKNLGLPPSGGPRVLRPSRVVFCWRLDPGGSEIQVTYRAHRSRVACAKTLEGHGASKKTTLVGLNLSTSPGGDTPIFFG